MVDAQYVVDVAAQMSGGDQTIAQLDAMTANLMGAGKGADFFSEAIATVSTQLTAAKAAAVTANDALAAGNEQYAQLEKAAVKAATALEKARQKDAVTPELIANANAAAIALDHYGVALKAAEQDAAKANAAEKQLGVTLANVKKLASHTDKSIASQAESTEKLRGALAAVPGPVGKLGSALLAPIQGFQKLSAEQGASNAAALLGVTAFAGLVIAIAAVTAALVIGVVSVAAWSVGLADSARSAGLATNATEVLHPELEALHETIDGLTDSTGLSEKALDGIATSLKAAHVSAKDMPATLEAAANAEALLGQGGAQEFIQAMQKSGKSVAAFSAQVNDELGGDVQKRLLGLDAQAARFQKNIGRLFGGLNIEPVLQGLKTLVDLFDENTAAGQTVKYIFESVFQPLIDQAQNAAYVIEAFALGFLIGMTKVYIAVKPAIRAVSEFFGFKDSSLTDTLDIAKKAGELIVPVFLVFAGVLAAVVAAVALVVAQLIIVQGVIYAFIAAVVYAGATLISGLVSAFQAVKDYLSGLGGDFSNLGTQLIVGLVNGITGGAASVMQAMVGLASGALKAAKDTLGIHSPSTEMYGVGDDTVAGYVNAVDDGHAVAQASMADLVTPPNIQSPLAMQAGMGSGGATSTSAAPANDAAAGGGHSGPTIIIQPGGVVMQGLPDAKTGVARFGEWLLDALEGDALSLGGAAVGGANG